MPVTIVVGGQFGSEGKGKVAHYFAKKERAKISIRVGGSNSGHTVIDSTGKAVIFRQLPTACLLSGVESVIGAGSYIKPDVLLQEIYLHKIDGRRVHIDPYAVVINDECQAMEASSELTNKIGSTQSGTGAAVVARILRDGTAMFAKDDERLKDFIAPTKTIMRNALSHGENLVLEGTQGYGLSVLHSQFYPFVTSRDTTAASFLSEAGLSPLDVKSVIMVIRAFPIRVAGNSGPLENEISWNELNSSSGAILDLTERTSVTGKIRRIAEFDSSIVNEAIQANNPNHIVLNHVDYVDRSIFDKNTLSEKSRSFLAKIAQGIEGEIDYVGTGPSTIFQNENRNELHTFVA